MQVGEAKKRLSCLTSSPLSLSPSLESDLAPEVGEENQDPLKKATRCPQPSLNSVKGTFVYRFDYIFKIVLIGDAVSELGTKAITIVSCSSSDVGEDVTDAEVCG